MMVERSVSERANGMGVKDENVGISAETSKVTKSIAVQTKKRGSSVRSM